MLSFCGIDKCSVDANGRIKLSPRVIEDFSARGKDVVLHCLPEGTIAVYPEDVYLEMRKHENNPAERAADSIVFRRTLRRFGAWTQSETISAQGRITLPQMFREHAKLANGCDAVVVGIEIGVEICIRVRWVEDQRKIMEHAMKKDELEMMQDLQGGSAE